MLLWKLFFRVFFWWTPSGNDVEFRLEAQAHSSPDLDPLVVVESGVNTQPLEIKAHLGSRGVLPVTAIAGGEDGLINPDEPV